MRCSHTKQGCDVRLEQRSVLVFWWRGEKWRGWLSHGSSTLHSTRIVIDYLKTNWEEQLQPWVFLWRTWKGSTQAHLQQGDCSRLALTSVLGEWITSGRLRVCWVVQRFTRNLLWSHVTFPAVCAKQHTDTQREKYQNPLAEFTRRLNRVTRGPDSPEMSHSVCCIFFFLMTEKQPILCTVYLICNICSKYLIHSL